MKGKIVITQRGGGLSFEEKELAAYNAGAAGIIIYDNVTGYGINMVVAPENMKIACVYVSKEAGEALINQKTVTFSEEFIKSTPSMSTFSSWGPTPELQIKPEITGIGGSVYSAYTNGGYAYASGTSMASPYVAGILALVKQSIQANYPSLTDEEIYNAVYQRVMSTADILTDLNGNYYPVRQQGAGLINAVSAIESEAYIYVQNSSKTKIELGDDKECRGIYNLTFRVMNLSASPITYFVDPIVLADEVSSDGYTLTQMGKVLEGAAYTVRVAEGGSADGYYITVDAQGYAVVTVRIELSEKDKAYITDNFEYGTYVEGWVILRPSDAEKCTLSIPYLTFFGDWTSLPILDSDIYNLDDTLTTGAFLYAYNYFYYFVPGSYTFSLPDGYEKPEADMDKAALSFDSYFEYKNYESTAAIFLGTRRNITGATIEIRNAISGEVYAIYESNTGISKSYYSEDNYVLSGYYIYFSPYDLHIPGNSLIEINVKVYANYLEDPQYKNNDTYSMTFRVDYESPTIENVTTEWVDEKLILSFDTWDEYYIQCATMAAINMSNWEKNLGAKYGIVNNYAVYFPAMSNGFKYPFIPAYTDKGETASFIFDITSIYYEYLSNPDAYTYAITVYDYALNPVTYCLDLSNLGKIEAFELDRTEITLDINEYTELVPLFTPNENVNKDVTWSVDNPEVISLENGRILALSAGTATVTAVTANGELSAQCVVTVTQNFASPYYAETITLDTESLSLVENSSYTLTIVSVEPWYTTNKNVLFASSDESVATVDENGKITGISEGNAIITVSAADGGGAQALCNVQVTSGYSEFTIEGTILKAYSGNAAVVVVPEEVTDIGTVFMNNTYIQKVILPEGITQLANYAFYNCTNLAEINIPANVTTIGNYCFDYCGSLSTVIFEGTALTSIGNYSFAFTTSLKAIDLPEGLTTINTAAFNASGIEEIVMPSTLSVIGDGAFYYALALRSVTFNEGLENICREAFYGCSSLKEIIIPDSVTSISRYSVTSAGSTSSNYYTFAYCTSLERVVLGSNVTKIGKYTFYGCSSLKEIEWGGVTALYGYAFAACGFEELTLPEQITSFNTYAFADNVNLKKVYYYSSVSQNYLFANCTSLETLIIAGNDYFTVVDNVLYTKDMKTLVLYPGGIAQNEFTVPEGVTRIEALAFRENDNLTKVILPESLVSIGHKAFYSCAALKTFEFRSYNAPLLEHYVNDDFYQYSIFTDKFLTNISDADGSLEMIRPSNGKGYDSKYYLTYFGTVQLSEEVYEPAAKELAATILNTQVFSLDDSDNIAQLRAAYDALSDAQKAHMGSEVLAKLTELENSIALLVSQAADLSAANVINDAIDIYFNSQYPSAQDMLDAIGKIMTDYDALTENQKGYVNYNVILYGYDLAEANIVSEAIAVLSAGSDKTDIENVRAAYEALNDTQKALVNNYSDLLTAEYNMLQSAYDEALKAAEDAEKAAQEAQKEIEDLKEQLRTSIISCQGESDALSITAALLLAVACAVLIIIKKKNKISNK